MGHVAAKVEARHQYAFLAIAAASPAVSPPMQREV
jgi:hypothetical protein